MYVPRLIPSMLMKKEEKITCTPKIRTAGKKRSPQRIWSKWTKIAGRPLPQEPECTRGATEREDSSQHKPMLEFDAAQPSLQGALILGEAFGIAEHLGEKANRNDLRAQQREYHAKQHGVNVNRDVPQMTWPREKPDNQAQADRQQTRFREAGRASWGHRAA